MWSPLTWGHESPDVTLPEGELPISPSAISTMQIFGFTGEADYWNWHGGNRHPYCRRLGRRNMPVVSMYV